MLFSYRTGSLLLVCALLSGMLFSQETPKSGEKAPEKGFHLSDTALLNISFSLAPEFETNINKVSDRSGQTDNITGASQNATEVMDLVIHLSPGLRAKIDDKFKTLGMAFLINYNLYTGLDDKKTFENLTTLSSLHFDTDILGEFNKDGNVMFRVSNNLKRNSNPDTLTIENGLHTNLIEDVNLALFIKNSEDTLSLKISTGIQLNYFEENLLGDYNFWSSRNTVYGQWKFLPKTAAFFNASFIYQDYFNADSALRDDQRSMPLSIFVGALGQLTPKISLKLSGGYTNSLSKDMHHDGLAGVEFIFKNSENTLFNLGYLRTMFPMATYQYYTLDKVYAGFTQKFFKRLLFKIDASYSHLAYGRNVKYPALVNVETVRDANTGAVRTTTVRQRSIDREDHLIRVEPMVSYNFLQWLGLSLKYTFETKQTPFYAATNLALTGVVPPSNITYTTYYDYMDHRILLTLAADY